MTGDPEQEPTAWSWTDLLAAVAAGRLRTVLTSASGARAVLIAETDLFRIEAGRAPAHAARAVLSPRELEVLGLVGEGLSGSAAAAHLGLATNTIAQHLTSVRRKLGVTSTSAAVERARAVGPLPGGPPAEDG